MSLASYPFLFLRYAEIMIPVSLEFRETVFY